MRRNVFYNRCEWYYSFSWLRFFFLFFHLLYTLLYFLCSAVPLKHILKLFECNSFAESRIKKINRIHIYSLTHIISSGCVLILYSTQYNSILSLSMSLKNCVKKIQWCDMLGVVWFFLRFFSLSIHLHNFNAQLHFCHLQILVSKIYERKLRYLCRYECLNYFIHI